MARSVGTLFVNLVTKTQKFEKGLNRASKRLKMFASSVKRYGVIGIGALVGLSSYAIKVASDFETITVRLETMLGSLGAAKKMMKDINAFSTRTPYEPGELAESATKLLSFGVAQDAVLGRMQLLGDIASGSGARIGELVSIFGKMKSSGVVALGDINQLGDRGIPIMETLKTQLGLTGMQLRKFVSTSQLGFDDVVTALQSMTREGGIFFGSMQKQSQTLAGQFSTLMGNVKLLAATLGSTLLPIVTQVVGQMNKFVSSFTSMASGGTGDAVINYFLKIGDVILNTMRGLKAMWLTLVASLATGLAKIVRRIPGMENSVNFGKLGELQGQASMARAQYKSGKSFSTMWRDSQIAKPTEYARNRGMQIDQNAQGYRPLTKIGGQSAATAGIGSGFGRLLAGLSSTMGALSNAAAIGRKDDVLGQRYAGLAERGTSAGYRAQQQKNSPMRQMNDTAKKQHRELKIHTDWLKEIAANATTTVAKLVTIPS